MNFLVLSNRYVGTPNYATDLLQWVNNLSEFIMEKIVNYRKAIWLAERTISLEDSVAVALMRHPTVVSTKFEYANDVDVQISRRDTHGVGIGCYFTLYSEGSQAATVENGGEAINRIDAPVGEEFLKTGIHLVIEGDHVGYLANGMTNDGQITALLDGYLRYAGTPRENTLFQLMPRADRDQIRALLSVGVKSIDIGVSSFATAIEAMRGENSSMLAAVQNFGRSIADVFTHDRSIEEAEAAADVEAKIHLGFDGRMARAATPRLLASIASEISDVDTGEFKIVTRNNDIITHDKLIVKRKMEVDGDEVALNSISAFTSIRAAMNDWRASGLFEE